MTNEHTKGTLKVERFGLRVRQAMLIWYGHVKRLDGNSMDIMVSYLQLPGIEQMEDHRKKMYLNVPNASMHEVGVRGAFARNVWRIRYGDP